MYYTNSQRKMLETKVILNGLFYALGIPIALLGVIANMDTWKANFLFVVGAIILITKAIYLIIEKEQKRRKTEMELDEKRHDLTKKKNNH